MNTQQKYIYGATACAFSAIATIAISTSASRYPGIGDFVLFALAAAVLRTEGLWILYASKAVIAVALFTLMFLCIKDRSPTRVTIAAAIIIALTIISSLGKAVVG